MEASDRHTPVSAEAKVTPSFFVFFPPPIRCDHHTVQMFSVWYVFQWFTETNRT